MTSLLKLMIFKAKAPINVIMGNSLRDFRLGRPGNLALLLVPGGAAVVRMRLLDHPIDYGYAV